MVDNDLNAVLCRPFNRPLFVAAEPQQNDRQGQANPSLVISIAVHQPRFNIQQTALFNPIFEKLKAFWRGKKWASPPTALSGQTGKG
jgi:hypothetical protein